MVRVWGGTAWLPPALPALLHTGPPAALHPCTATAVALLPTVSPAAARPAAARRYDNCEMRTVVLADEGGVHSHHDPLHFHGGPGVRVDPKWTATPTRP